MKKDFTNSKFKDYGDPDKWITSLEEIQAKIIEIAPNKTEYHISDESIMIQVINGLPKAYDIETNKLETDLENGSIDITDIRLKLNTRYESLENEDEDDNEKEDETAMTIDGPRRFKKQFKGWWNKCGKYGHRAIHCRSKPSFNNNNDNDNRNKKISSR